MDNAPVVQSALITSRFKPENRGLVCEKISSDFDASNFLFYLIDLPLERPEMGDFLETLNHVIYDQIADKEDFQARDFDDILSALNSAICKEAEQTDLESIFSLNMLIGLVSGQDILLSQTGKITGYIFRNNRISSLVSDKNDDVPTHPSKIFTDIISGDLVDKDRLVFAVRDTFDHLPLTDLKEIAKIKNPAKEATSIAAILRRHHLKSAAAIVIFADILDGETKYLRESEQCLFIDDDDPTVKHLKKQFAQAREKSRAGSTAIASGLASSFKKLIKYLRLIVWPRIVIAIRKYLPVLADHVKKTKTELGKNLKALESAGNYRNIKIKAIAYTKHSNEKSFFENLKLFFQNVFSRLLHIGLLFRRENRKYLYILLILVALVFGYVKISQNNTKKEALTAKIQLDDSCAQAQTDFNNFKSDLALGKTTDYKQIYAILARAEKAESSAVNGDKATALAKDINTYLDTKTKTTRFYASPFDSGGLASKIVLSGEQIYGVTPDGQIYLADARDRSHKLIAAVTKDMGAPVDMNFSKQDNRIIITTDKQKLLALDLANYSLTELAVSEDPKTWEQSSAIATYSTNIYLLDSVSGQVWKHTLSDSGFSKGSKYADTRKVDLKQAKDLAVDGNIFVLKSDGHVAEFVHGALSQDFELHNIPSLVDQDKINATRIYTDDGTSSLFILDSNAGKILQFDKTGNFVNQYVFDGVKLDDFVVNTKLQKIWGLSAGKIYEGNL